MVVLIGPQGLSSSGIHSIGGRAIRLGKAQAFPELEYRRFAEAEVGLYVFERVPKNLTKN
jgi:hypothetical protein